MKIAAITLLVVGCQNVGSVVFEPEALAYVTELCFNHSQVFPLKRLAKVIAGIKGRTPLLPELPSNTLNLFPLFKKSALPSHSSMLQHVSHWAKVSGAVRSLAAQPEQCEECEICMEKNSDYFNVPCGFQVCRSCQTKWENSQASVEQAPCPRCRERHRKAYPHSSYVLDKSAFPFKALQKPPVLPVEDAIGMFYSRVVSFVDALNTFKMNSPRNAVRIYEPYAYDLLKMAYLLFHADLMAIKKPFSTVKVWLETMIDSIEVLVFNRTPPYTIIGELTKDMLQPAKAVAYYVKQAINDMKSIVHDNNLKCFAAKEELEHSEN
jgi:hypothetical protein